MTSPSNKSKDSKSDSQNRDPKNYRQNNPPNEDSQAPDTTDIDNSRRRFLTAGVSIVGGIGGGVSAWPFIASMTPSARAQAIGAPVTVDISKLQPGEMLRDQWRGKPIWIVRRTKDQVKQLQRANKKLRDPQSTDEQQPGYARNFHRSIRPDILVLVGICTHLGCSPTYRPDSAPEDLGEAWKGGFFCACHGSRFDLAGRVYANVPAPKNLEVPPHRFAEENIVVIGESEEGLA